MTLPHYQVRSAPDHLAIGEVLDRAICRLVHEAAGPAERRVAIRAVSLIDHPGMSHDDLTATIVATGTDRYDPARVGPLDHVYGPYGVELHAIPCTVSPAGLRSVHSSGPSVMAEVVSDFYLGPPVDRGGVPLRVDVVTVYDLRMLEGLVIPFHGDEPEPTAIGSAGRPPTGRIRGTGGPRRSSASSRCADLRAEAASALTRRTRDAATTPRARGHPRPTSSPGRSDTAGSRAVRRRRRPDASETSREDSMDYTTPRPDLYDVPYTATEFHGMPYRQLGASGLRASVIGLGTWKFGYPHTGDGARVDERTAFAIFDRAVELGVTFWDTANRYNAGSGNSERLIGRWFRANPDQRRNIVLATKLYGGMDGATPNHSGLSRGNIRDALHASLSRLQLDYVDLLYFHRFDPTVPIEESLETIEDLVREGLIRYFAVSNFTKDQLASYLEVQRGLSRRCRPVAVQNKYDPLGREPEPYVGVLEFCAAHDIAFVPYSPLAGGLLTTRYLDPAKAGAGDRLVDEGTLQSVATPEKLAAVRRLVKLAESWDMAVNQLALAYLLTLPGMGPQIPSSSTVAQLESNAAAGRIVLTEEQVREVEAALAPTT